MDDSIGENAENFTVSIQSASIPVSRPQATVVIQEDAGGIIIIIVIKFINMKAFKYVQYFYILH